ncbi:MAG: hypothetical protein ACOY31_04560 [Bacillota bacterium]
MSLILIFTKNIWLPEGYIIFSDLDFGYDDSLYIDRIAGLFNNHFSSFNFFNLSRLVFISPFYLPALLFGKIYPCFLLRSIILGVIIISALGMFLLCEKLLLKSFGQFQHNYHYIGLIIPALFYALNPWVMFRIQHIFLLAGYAFYPWVLFYLLDLFKILKSYDKLDDEYRELCIFRRKITISADLLDDITTSVKIAFFVGAGSASIHYFFYYILTFISLGIIIFIHNSRLTTDIRGLFKNHLRKNVVLYSACTLFSAYWIFAYFSSMLLTSIEPQNVNVVDTLTMFSQYSDLRNVLYLISYWWPMFDTKSQLDNLFWIGGGIFLAITAYIIFYRFSWHFYIRLFTGVAVAVLILAMGVNTDIIADFNVYLATKVPIIGHIFRDPNKLIGPMTAYFAILIGFGVDRVVFILRMSGFSRYVQIAFVLCLIIAFYFYYRPFGLIFASGYYSGTEIPAEYKEIQKEYLPGGKIFWTPVMDNLILSNGMSNYTWNSNGSPGGFMKTVSDFHLFSSNKNTIFQNENNNGMVSYFNSFFQCMLDRASGQHLGNLLAWAGFNELGFHNDVFGQEERQAFNKKVLDAQDDLQAVHKDDIFTTYKTPYEQDSLFGANRLVYTSKGLDSVIQILDNRDKLKIDLRNTGLIWGQSRIQDVKFEDNDLLVGDSAYDMIIPNIDEQYFIHPFNYINTGNPYTGWAKTLTREAEWFWTLKYNDIKEFDWGYDYGRGIVYTNSPYKLSIPSYKIKKNQGTELLNMKSIMNDFFTPDNSDIFKLTYFPDAAPEGAALEGTIKKGFSGANVWQVAKSKPIKIPPGRYIRINALVSGVNAGKMHFKAYFFNSKGEELKVSYLAPGNEMSEFMRSPMVCDAYVPEDTDYMKIYILSTQDTIKNSYFWIHDFSIYDISDFRSDNMLVLPVKQKSPGNRFRALARVYISPSSNYLTVRSGSNTINVPLMGYRQGFNWIDLGEITVEDKKIEIVPGEGFTCINSILMLPRDRYSAIIQEAARKIKGKQADLSLARFDYKLKSDFEIKDLEDVVTFPNSIGNSLLPVQKGELNKNIDILKEGDYDFDITGNITRGSGVRAIITDSNGREQVLQLNSSGGKPLPRSFQGFHCNVKYVENKYYLTPEANITDTWNINRYSGGTVHLLPGTYRVSLVIESAGKNYASASSLHILKENEIVAPRQEAEPDDILLTSIARYKMESSEKTVNGKKIITNSPTASKLWFIDTLNRIPVKKGQIVTFRAKYKMSGVTDLHAKLAWMDKNRMLISSQYLSSDRMDLNEFYITTVAPVDGFVQPCFFMHGTTETSGSFQLDSADFFIVDDMVKIEGTSLIPADVQFAAPGQVYPHSAGFVKTNSSRYLIFNEAFNNVWRFIGTGGTSSPVIINLLHNGYAAGQDPDASTGAAPMTGFVMINPLISISYYLGLAVSLLAHITGLWFYLTHRRLKRVRNTMTGAV